MILLQRVRVGEGVGIVCGNCFWVMPIIMISLNKADPYDNSMTRSLIVSNETSKQEIDGLTAAEHFSLRPWHRRMTSYRQYLCMVPRVLRGRANLSSKLIATLVLIVTGTILSVNLALTRYSFATVRLPLPYRSYRLVAKFSGAQEFFYGEALAMTPDGATLIMGVPRAQFTSVFCDGDAPAKNLRLFQEYSGDPKLYLSKQQGRTVAISADGSILAVGTPYDDYESGAVWIAERTSGKANFTTKLRINGKPEYNHLGGRLAMSKDGSTIAVNSRQSVVVYGRSGAVGTWSQEAGSPLRPNYPDLRVYNQPLCITADGNKLVFGGQTYTPIQQRFFAYKRDPITKTWENVSVDHELPGVLSDVSCVISDDGSKLLLGTSSTHEGIKLLFLHITKFGKFAISQTLDPLLPSLSSKMGYVLPFAVFKNFTRLVVGDSGSLAKGYAQGRVYFYEYEGTRWRLVPGSLNSASLGGPDVQFGMSIAVSEDGNRLAIGAVRGNERYGTLFVVDQIHAIE